MCPCVPCSVAAGTSKALPILRLPYLHEGLERVMLAERFLRCWRRVRGARAASPFALPGEASYSGDSGEREDGELSWVTAKGCDGQGRGSWLLSLFLLHA